MAKTKKNNIENENSPELEINKEPIELVDEKKDAVIILLASSKMVKHDTEKKVSGNVANILLKKGFAKLKK